MFSALTCFIFVTFFQVVDLLLPLKARALKHFSMCILLSCRVSRDNSSFCFFGHH